MKKLFLPFLIVVLVFGVVYLAWYMQIDPPFGAEKNEISGDKIAEKYEKASEKFKEKYKLENGTLKMKAKDDPRDVIRVTIGDEPVAGQLGAAPDFNPSVTISRWDEVSFKITPKALETVELKNKNVDFLEDKIVFTTPDVDYNLYDLPTSEDLPEGGFEYEVILKEKPKTNIISYDVNTNGLNFWYQGELPQELLDNGDYRPDEIIDSYAIYLTESRITYTEKNKYAVGKVGHIYRSKIIDANGDWVWGKFNKDLNETGILTITIPQEFLNNAIYPIIVDPTFGYMGNGGTKGSRNDNEIRCTKSYAFGSGTGSKVWGYLSTDATSPGMDLKGVLANSSAEIVSNGIGDSTEFTSDTSDVPEWTSSSFSTGPTITDGTIYYSCIIYNEYQDVGHWYDLSNYSVVSGDSIGENDNNFSSPQNLSGYSSFSLYYSIYTEYNCEGECADAYVYPGTYTWTAPTGVTSARVGCWGAGGKGQNGGDAYGGGGGAYAEKEVSVTPESSYTVVVGDAGTGSGNDSTFNGTDVVAKGGARGDTGGAGGQASASTGTTKYDGGDGAQATPGGGGGGAGDSAAGGDGSSSTGGTGGSSFGGNGGDGHSYNGDNGERFGGGGGGSTSGAGGYGSNGACIIWYTVGGAPATEEPIRANIIIFD